ncbi:hypothetical protein K0040_05485 [Terrisporobacter petrolearius]|uniref:hypothetical protein n=1 Tax=Terrisporobacter petrolearius TaxID=1460447 RepID=UPI001D1633ED|nr:hypothetical protein [Terrisporobacter petrolearius]MCC3863765.1 hypothetical protein [Terrisporobacter petrolearius]
MQIFVKKIFNLSDIRYPWLLLISMIAFMFSLYNNKINPEISTMMEFLTYGMAIAIAIVWSILNYIDHMKINVLLRRYDNIDVFVDNLVLNKQEKEDLKSYLNDFVKDLQDNGKTKDEATKAAIAQFQVEEFTSVSKNSGIFELSSHYYLIGYILIFAIIMTLIGIFTNTILDDSFLLKAMNFMLNLYSIGLFILLFLYKIIDNLVIKKIIH